GGDRGRARLPIVRCSGGSRWWTAVGVPRPASTARFPRLPTAAALPRWPDSVLRTRAEWQRRVLYESYGALDARYRPSFPSPASWRTASQDAQGEVSPTCERQRRVSGVF